MRDPHIYTVNGFKLNSVEVESISPNIFFIVPRNGKGWQMSEIPLPYRHGAYNKNTSEFNWFTWYAPCLSIRFCVFEWILSL